MKTFRNFFFKNNEKSDNERIIVQDNDQFIEIGKLVKEARLKKNLSIKELSVISKIPESSINSIEKNINDLRPKYPFIRSILLKLEKCLSLKENTLVGLVTKEGNSFNKNNKNKYLISKIDLLKSWRGCVVYFLLLMLTLFVLNQYFISNINIIEFQIQNMIKHQLNFYIYKYAQSQRFHWRLLLRKF